MAALQENPTKRRRLTLNSAHKVICDVDTSITHFSVSPPIYYDVCEECGTHTDLGIEKLYTDLVKSRDFLRVPPYTAAISRLKEEMDAFVSARSKFTDAIKEFQAKFKDTFEEFQAEMKHKADMKRKKSEAESSDSESSDSDEDV